MENEQKKDLIIFERKCQKQGKETITITIPKNIVSYLNIKKGDVLQIAAENGKYGKFISVWKKKEE